MRFRTYLNEEKKRKNDPCQPGYVQVGMKMKNGKKVPNCVPQESLEEEKKGEYEGREVTLEKPFRLESGANKKFGVYVKNDKGNIVKVTFGDPNMEIKRDDDEARKNFRSRHNCSDPGPKWKARYWSCYQWRKGSNVED